MSQSAAGMCDLKECVEPVTVGNGKVIQSSMIGKKKGTIVDKSGKRKTVAFNHCKFVPDLGSFHLHFIPHCLEEGFQLGNEGRNITLKKEPFTLFLIK